MAVSTCCCNTQAVGSIIRSKNLNNSRDFDDSVSSTPQRSLAIVRGKVTTLATLNKEKIVDTVSSRCVNMVAMGAAAALSLTVFASAPAVHAVEREASQFAGGDLSMSIAIPIPHQETWLLSQYGFVAPLPRNGRAGASDMQFLGFQGSCPAWQPSQFETVVPDRAHAKPFPRQGSVWPALYMFEETAIEYPASKSQDSVVKYTSIMDVLVRMSNDSRLRCFSL